MKSVTQNENQRVCVQRRRAGRVGGRCRIRITGGSVRKVPVADPVHAELKSKPPGEDAGRNKPWGEEWPRRYLASSERGTIPATQECVTIKTKGRHPSQDVALSIRFVEDPVRRPNRNAPSGYCSERASQARTSRTRRDRRHKSFITSI
jgi:hypothetical protein